jgi:hypothetical protein
MSLALAVLLAGAEAVVATPEKTITEVSPPTVLGMLERGLAGRDALAEPARLQPRSDLFDPACYRSMPRCGLSHLRHRDKRSAGRHRRLGTFPSSCAMATPTSIFD